MAATQAAARDCAHFLQACLNIGWEKEQLDILEELWWKYHDQKGNLIQRQELPRSTQARQDDWVELQNGHIVGPLKLNAEGQLTIAVEFIDTPQNIPLHNYVITVAPRKDLIKQIWTRDIIETKEN